MVADPIRNSHLTSSNLQRQAVPDVAEVEAQVAPVPHTVESGSTKRQTPDRRCIQENTARYGRVGSGLYTATSTTAVA